MFFSPVIATKPHGDQRSKLMQSSLRKRLRKSFIDEDDEMLEEAPRKRPCDPSYEQLDSLDPVRRKLDFNRAVFDTPMSNGVKTESDPFIRMIDSAAAVPKFGQKNNELSTGPTRRSEREVAVQLEGLLE